jgi:ubiquinone biosynthesis protein Coq4
MEQAEFWRLAAVGGDAERVAAAAKAGDGREAQALAAFLAHAAFAAPDRIAAIYDAAALGWRGEAVKAAAIAPVADAPLPLGQALMAQFWQLAGDTTTGMDAGEITGRTAALASLLAHGFDARAAAACLRYPAVAEAAASGFPARSSIEALQVAPAGSLGHELCRMIVENGYDLEVLDRDALELSKLRPPLDYLNARILQTHDLWHIVAGYRLTKLHEIALSAFQLAQFGHNYSAMFLAVVVASAAFHTPAAVPLLLETILSAWAHGRATPPLMAIAWERDWHLSADAIRAAHGISEYASPFPADLIEMFEATAQAA